MKIQSRDGNKITYVDVVSGRECRTTTANGPQAAERLFAIIRGQNGAAVSTPLPQDLTPTPRVP